MDYHQLNEYFKHHRMDDTEVYIFLGVQHDVHFYMHTVYSHMFDPVITYQIYNVLINDKQIVSPKDNVIIYELCTETKSCDVIMISHFDNPSNPTIFKKNLEEFFLVLLGAKRNDLSTIKYDYSKKVYSSFYIDDFDFTKHLDVSCISTPIHINNIKKVITRKAILPNS